MKIYARIALVLLFIPVCLPAQPYRPGSDSALVRNLEGLPGSEPFDTAHPWKMAEQPYVYILSDNDLYSFFGYRLYVRYRDFDFNSFHILGVKECRLCQGCHHDKARKECHPETCRYNWVWKVRDNKKAFRDIPSVTVAGHIDAFFPTGRDSFYRDTVIARISDSTLTAWYTEAGGDCHATFRYSLVRDNYYPVLLLKERNYYGGCRGAGFWDFTISFTMPGGVQHYVKRTILMDRNGRPE